MITGRRGFLRASLAVSSTMCFGASRAWTGGATLRPFRWEDAYHRVEANSVAISTEGAVALEVTRPLSAAGAFYGPAWSSLVDTRGELWLLHSDLADPRRLPALPGGSWAASFSPDGKRLAALSLIGPGRVGVVVWGLESGKYEACSECNVEVFLAKFRTAESAYAGPSGFFQIPRQYIWLDDTSILYVDHGAEAQQSLLGISSLSATQYLLRERTETGHLSVRVWSDQSPTCGAGSRLVRLFCDTGRRELLYEGDVRGVSLSPDRRSVAVVVAMRNIPPTPDRRVNSPLRATTPFDDPMVELSLVAIPLGRPGAVQKFAEVAGVGNVAPSRLPIWSEDCLRIAMPVRTIYSDAPSTGDDAVWEVTVSTGRVDKRPAVSALDAEILAALITTDGLNTARTLRERPQAIRVDDYTGGGQIKGGAWRCAPRRVMIWNAPNLVMVGPARTMLIDNSVTAIQSLVMGGGVARTIGSRADGRRFVITTEANGEYSIEELDANPQWQLLGVRAKDSAVIYKEDAHSGTSIIMARPRTRPLFSPLRFNTYFNNVICPDARIVRCPFPDGTVRRGVLVMPIGHKRGERHPVIVWAYPNSVPSADDYFVKVNDENSVIRPIQYLLTRGFAFLQAPFPIGDKTGVSNSHPMRSAVDAVLPWLDSLNEQADVRSGEYGFFGHSNAGYVALALEALTSRFKAIVAWDTFPEIGFDSLHSNWSDVVLNCAGNVVQSDRKFYEDPKQPYAPEPSPPWRRPATFIRNDPLFNLNRASTPLLLVEGEFDSDPREMEEVYSILYGRGVPVQLAYYWGEDHVFASPANIRDAWRRTEEFFAKYLARY